MSPTRFLNGSRWRTKGAVTEYPYVRAPRLLRRACDTGHRAYGSWKHANGYLEVMSNDKSAQAREGLLDSIAGKAKEVAGAVTGRDDLVEEGQLQQTEAANRKAAVADEAIAEAKRGEAAQELREANRDAAVAKGAARTQAQRDESAAERQRQAEHDLAARDAEREESAGREAAERHADALAESRLRDAEAIAAEAEATEERATNEQRRLERDAAAADQQAAQLRAETEK